MGVYRKGGEENRRLMGEGQGEKSPVVPFDFLPGSLALHVLQANTWFVLKPCDCLKNNSLS